VGDGENTRKENKRKRVVLARGTTSPFKEGTPKKEGGEIRKREGEDRESSRERGTSEGEEGGMRLRISTLSGNRVEPLSKRRLDENRKKGVNC